MRENENAKFGFEIIHLARFLAFSLGIYHDGDNKMIIINEAFKK